MNKVIIIGAGFAGLSAAKKLSRFKRSIDITLIDKKNKSNFLPMLPDIISERVSAEFLTYDIEAVSKKWGVRFINEEVTSLDLEKQIVKSRDKELAYDYLIIASGSETNFYGNKEIQNGAYKLDSAVDGLKILEALKDEGYDTYAICGGGYTGIEMATNLRRYLKKRDKDKKIIIIELGPSILGPLPEWMKEYVRNNLKRLNIEIFLKTSVEKIEGKRIFLSGGRAFDNSLLIWAAGVKVPDFVDSLNFEKNKQGRLNVNEYLQLSDKCFVVGDCGQFSYKDNFLRMAVQFSIAQGYCAASNIIRSIKGRRLRKYKPMDFGYIIPMANNRSCGRVLGINMRGFLPTVFHYTMCIYRSLSFKNKVGVFFDLMRK